MFYDNSWITPTQFSQTELTHRQNIIVLYWAKHVEHRIIIYMHIKAQSPDDYVAQVPEERKEAIERLRQIHLDHLPPGFTETISYGMIGYVVPHSTYPDGYHCDPSRPLPFISIASQKSHIGLYHMGIYAQEELMTWFQEEWPNHSTRKLDMGKSCIRFKKPEHIPFDLIAQLATKMTPADWISFYEAQIKR